MSKDKNNQAEQSRKKIFTKLIARFLRLNISQKMHLGFLPLVVLLILVSTFALGKLNQLTSLNESILMVDIPAQETIRRMKTMAIDQESILRRFIILKDNAFLNVFDNNNLGFSKHVATLKTLSGLSEELEFPLADLEKAYNNYASALLAGIKRLTEQPDNTSDFDAEIKTKQTKLLKLLVEFTNIAKANQDKKVAISASIGSLAFKFALALCIIGTALSAAGAALVTNNIVNAVKKLHRATEEISQGRFDHLPDINNKDELGNLAQAFVKMAKRLKNLEEMYLDASPLTRLPGGVAIENMLKKRIETKKLFAFCLLDIDNFKSFNDHYGYAQGNRMIQETAAIIEDLASKHGSDEDFIGHIGGDDFVIITTPDKYKNICQLIIEKFDEKAPTFYSDSDRKRGYIAGANRQGEEVKFPLASISIAVVNNQGRVIKNHIEVGEIAAELKEYAKSTAGSSIAEDNRQGPKRTTKLTGQN
ncbi:MAG: diguanylate cyclase [Thermodesulfobacteriota bacterium]